MLYKNQQNVNASLDEKEKFSQNWLRPYVINEDYGPREYKLKEIDGTTLK